MPTKPLLSRPTFVFLLMASFFSFFLLILLSLSSPSSSFARSTKPHFPKPKPKTPSFSPSVPSQIIQACKATRFPDLCQSTLSNSPPNPTPVQIIQSTLTVSTSQLETARSMVDSILKSSQGNFNRTTAAKNCQEVLDNSHYRIQSTSAILQRGNGKTKDARAYMSAAVLYQYDCWNALKYANDTSLTAQTMSFIDNLTMVTSNALSMVRAYDIFGEDTNSWAPPKTERDGFWEGTSSLSVDYFHNKGIASVVPKLRSDVTVCKDGSEWCYKTVQEAVNAAPDNKEEGKFVIYIKEGVYEEIVRVPLEKKNLVFLGEGMGKTVITNSLKVGQPGISTYNTATVAVLGDGFMASGLTIQNTAGPPTHQAVAFRLDSDQSIIENCEFLGNQDTLYAHALRQYYKSCRIQGNVDFIFGNSAAVFQDCEILVTPRQEKPEKGENNAVTAHGRTDPAQSTGFVFQNCLINGTKEYMALYNRNAKVHKNFLGRPWKEYSRVIFIKCQMEALITAPGWMPWTGDFALNTLYYGEFQNTGPGSDLSQRVKWSSQIPAEHVPAYSLQNFIQGNDWISSSS